MRMHPRKWMVERLGRGFMVVHQNEYGTVGPIEPTDPVDGDDLESCRQYFGGEGLFFDLYVEPGNRIFVKQEMLRDDEISWARQTPVLRR